VGVDDRGVFDVVVELWAGPHVRLHLQFDPGAVRPVPRGGPFVSDLGLVVVGVDDELEILRVGAPLSPAGDFGGLAGGELGVEDSRGDADSLLAAAVFHAQCPLVGDDEVFVASGRSRDGDVVDVVGRLGFLDCLDRKQTHVRLRESVEVRDGFPEFAQTLGRPTLVVE
jgi:hypothetical protein